MTSACDIAEKRVRTLWTRGDAALREKAMSIGLQLEAFLIDLDSDPLFSRMPPADNNFYYLWMLFLNWGKPEAIWNYEECGLMGLSLEEIFIAFGISEIEGARYMLSDAAEHPQGWTRPEANKLAASHLRAVDRTLDLLDAQACRH